jgi:hypothetical protein
MENVDQNLRSFTRQFRSEYGAVEESIRSVDGSLTAIQESLTNLKPPARAYNGHQKNDRRIALPRRSHRLSFSRLNCALSVAGILESEMVEYFHEFF